MIWIRVLLALASAVLVLPYLATSAQDASRAGQPAAQTVAQGIIALPADSMVWQSELHRALVSPRAEAVPQAGGFILADNGTIAITDADGKPLQRLAPGEATWIAPGEIRAIVSLEGRSAGYLRISLIPARLVPEQPVTASHGDPFPAPSGLVDLDLLRDILERGEELAVASGDVPALLQVTSGKVYVTNESGEIVEVATGSPHQFQGKITLSGSSRAPAAFVIAALGHQVPARVALFDPNATPVATPRATPQAIPLAVEVDASLVLEAWLCPPGYDEASLLNACVVPATGVRFTAETEDERVNRLTDFAGQTTFASLPPDALTLRANVPEGATTAVASCRNVRGDAQGRVRDNTLALSLEPGARVTCAWFIEPGEMWPAATLSVSVLACPPGMTREAWHPEFCVPTTTDFELELRIEEAVLEPAQVAEGLWVWAPLLERSYDLTLSDLPDDFNGAVLDDGETGKEGDALPVELGDDLAPVRTLYLLQPPAANAAEVDSDGDRLTDAQELDYSTDPYQADTDGDGLADGDESNVFGTDPLQTDTDDDGLNDLEEVATYFTNPFLADTDDDGVSDADEVTSQTDPLDMLSQPPTATLEATATPSPAPTATPAVVLSPVVTAGTPTATAAATPRSSASRAPAVLPTLAPDASPISHAFPHAGTALATDGEAALDNDGLATLDEIAIHGTDPLNPDTDEDGTNDGDEVASGSDPLDPAN